MDVPITNVEITQDVPCRFVSAILYWHTYTNPSPILPILVAVHSTDSIHSAYYCPKTYDNSFITPLMTGDSSFDKDSIDFLRL